jgi:hypothetical protein
MSPARRAPRHRWAFRPNFVRLCMHAAYENAGGNRIRITSVESCIFPIGLDNMEGTVEVEPYIRNEGQFIWSKKSTVEIHYQMDIYRGRCATVYPNITVKKGEGNRVWVGAQGTISDCVPIGLDRQGSTQYTCLSRPFERIRAGADWLS